VDGRILIKLGTLVQAWTKSSFLQKQDGGGRHLGFWKNSHNFAQD